MKPEIGDQSHSLHVDDIPVTFVGHPYASSGVGEQYRSHVRACSALSLHHQIFDIYKFSPRTDPSHLELFNDIELSVLPSGIRIFHINGDEVQDVLRTLDFQENSFGSGYNVIVPAWELPVYPEHWAEQLHLFDEVWALSTFIQKSLEASGVSSKLIGQSVEIHQDQFWPRRAFGIRETAFVLLHFFDLSSYVARKNPEAVLSFFEKLKDRMPEQDLQLVLKVKNGEQPAIEWAERIDRNPDIIVIDKPLETRGVRSLINACDGFISLHRAEGFGRGLGEAMSLGRLAVGTNWSGNVDFMDSSNSVLVNCNLVPVGPDEYPFGEGQMWAQPDVDHAVEMLSDLLPDLSRRRAICSKAQLDAFKTYGNRAVGLRIYEQLERIVREIPENRLLS